MIGYRVVRHMRASSIHHTRASNARAPKDPNARPPSRRARLWRPGASAFKIFGGYFKDASFAKTRLGAPAPRARAPISAQRPERGRTPYTVYRDGLPCGPGPSTTLPTANGERSDRILDSSARQDRLDSYSTATRQLYSTATRQTSTDLDRPRQTRQTSTDLDRNPLEPMCLGVKVSSSTAVDVSRLRRGAVEAAVEGQCRQVSRPCLSSLSSSFRGRGAVDKCRGLACRACRVPFEPPVHRAASRPARHGPAGRSPPRTLTPRRRARG